MVMNMFAVWLGFVFLSGFVFQSCSMEKRGEIKEINSAEYNLYFPAEKGNYWEYFNEASREETEIYKIKISNLVYAGKDKIATFNSFPFFSKTEAETLLRIKESGEVYLIESGDKSDTTEKLMIPSESKLKKDYNWMFGGWSGTVAGTEEKVKTEEGVYKNCIKLNYAISFTFTAEIWLAKNTGIVKWGYHRTNPPSLPLTYYVLNKIQLKE